MDRNRLPRVVNRLIDHVADSPNGLLGRLAALRMGRPLPKGSVGCSSFDPKPIQLLIAPVNYSGQGFAWARALEQADSEVSARNMAYEVQGGFAFASDLTVPLATFHNDRDWQRRQFKAASSATHVLIEAEEPPFGRLLGRSVTAQVEALLANGVNVAFLAHGTDVRLPSRHIASHPRSYYDDSRIYLPRAEAVAERNIRVVQTSGRTAFVSTPDLLLDLPDAFWCPVVVDTTKWRATSRVERAPGAPLRVAHAPSVAAYKGTDLILPTLSRLVDEGLIEVDLIQGVASEDMPARLASADVLLDQFRTGSYGVAACEALASGCVVVGEVSQQVRSAVLEASGFGLPVIEASVEGLEAALRLLAAESTLEPRRDEGLQFVDAVHSGEYSAQVLTRHWLSLPQ